MHFWTFESKSRLKMIFETYNRYFFEYCWISNFTFFAYLMSLYLFGAEIYSVDTRAKMACFLYCAAAGPLATAALILNNALIPHSFDHMMSLLIHFQPIMTAFTMKRYPNPLYFPGIGGGREADWELGNSAVVS
jgi:hypothetical protein